MWFQGFAHQLRQAPEVSNLLLAQLSKAFHHTDGTDQYVPCVSSTAGKNDSSQQNLMSVMQYNRFPYAVALVDICQLLPDNKRLVRRQLPVWRCWCWCWWGSPGGPLISIQRTWHNGLEVHKGIRQLCLGKHLVCTDGPRPKRILHAAASCPRLEWGGGTACASFSNNVPAEQQQHLCCATSCCCCCHAPTPCRTGENSFTIYKLQK